MLCRSRISWKTTFESYAKRSYSKRSYSSSMNHGKKSFNSYSTLALIGGFALVGVVSYGSYRYGRQSIILRPPEDVFPLSSTTRLDEISPPTYCTDAQFKEAIAKLKEILGSEKVFDSPVEIAHHSRNEFTTHVPLEYQKPKYVIYPTSTEEVSQAMKIINEYNVPVVPFSAGTSLEGNFHSTRPGIVLDTSRMNKVLEVHYDDLDAVVQSGVSWQMLNDVLEPSGLMFGPDCGPSGQISGMVSTNASGINASRYGAMISNVISLTVVLADGTIIKTKQRPRKTSAGYNLTGLFIGSEGTLGIVTEATVKLHVRPRYETVVVGQFPTIKDTTNTVAQLFRAGLQPNAIEMLDGDMMHTINYSGYFSREWLECPTLFFKIGGINKKVVDEYIREMKQIALQNNCQDFLFARNEEEQEELFSARKNAFFAILNYGRNEIDEDIRLWVTDVAVPISKLPIVLDKVNKLIKSSGLQSVIVGHLGDGNFHADLFYKPDQMSHCEKVVNELIDIGLANEGTCTGEHGVGNTKRVFLLKELGSDPVDLMRKLKFSLDPKRLLNPDKIFKIDPTDDSPY
ncbi:uncharacterized protein PRCAT00004616001 [Priceomyces carsonii]|uniref:uncharacterized protein n=1 Tax=Priceomyces carsonii TaxID=28549 RepID=UPI002ED8BEF6|nr:unnamed protein product [Priceomyces carsonii]